MFFKSLLITFKNRKVLTSFLLFSYVVGFLAISLSIGQYILQKDNYQSMYTGEPDEVYHIILGSIYNEFPSNRELLDTVSKYVGSSEVLISNGSSYLDADINARYSDEVEVFFQGYEKEPTFTPPIISGRVMDSKETMGSKPVAVVGKEVAALFDEILIDGVAFEIVGTMGFTRMSSIWDHKIFLPINFLDQLDPLDDRINHRLISYRGNPIEIREAAIETERILGSLRLRNNITISPGYEIYISYSYFFITLILAIIILIITNINVINLTSFWMYSRKKEIGIRKAIGATNSTISKLVINDLLFLSFSGAGLALLIQYIAAKYIEIDFPLNIVPTHFVFAVIIPIFCGYLTARIPLGIVLRFEPQDIIRGGE